MEINNQLEPNIKDNPNPNAKKNKIIAISAMIAIIAIIGIAFAIWLGARTQVETNVMTTLACLGTSLNENTNGVNLQEAHPLSEIQGKETSPFIFTIVNNCPTNTIVDINLEVLVASTLGHEFVRVLIEEPLDSAELGLDENSKLLTTFPPAEETIEEATSYRLVGQILMAKNEELTFDLRIWLDQNTPFEEGSDKLFRSKITILAMPTDLDRIIPEPPVVHIAGPFTTPTGNTPTQWVNNGTTSYYRVVVESEEDFTSNFNNITANNGVKGAITGIGSQSDPFVIPVTATSNEGTASITVGAGAFKVKNAPSESASSGTFIVHNTPPVINVTNPSVNSPIGLPYSNLTSGVSVTDDLGTNPTINVSGTVNHLATGNYVITYTATDAAGNQAVPATRTVTVTPVTLTNMLTNGGFETNTTGWATATYTLSRVAVPTPVHGEPGSWTARISGSGNVDINLTASPAITVVSGRRYYVSAIGMSTTVNGTGIQFNNNTTSLGISQTFGINTWTRVSGVWQSNTASLTFRVVFLRENGNNAKDVYLDNIMLIDLTTPYGAGNEPTAQQINAILTGTNRFWEGTRVIN